MKYKVLFCLFVCSVLKAEYYCDGDRCSDYKLGFGALAGIHSTPLHSISMQGLTLRTLVSQYNSQYGFVWNLNLSILNARVDNAQNNVIAYNKDTFRTLGGYVDTTLFFAKNMKNSVQEPLFIGVLLGGESLFFDAHYGIPVGALFTLGVGTQGTHALKDKLFLEYGFSYHYGVYGFYDYPIRYSPSGLSMVYSSLKPNNHQIRAFIGLHHNKLYGLYTKIHLTLTHLDSASSALTNRYGTSSIYPRALQALVGIELGFGFNSWF